MKNFAMDLTFWKGKRVLITGHTGFKGSWLCVLLDALGAKVYGYALAPPTRPSLFELAGLGDLIDSTIGDIRDLQSLKECMQRAGPEVVLHMAAQSVVLDSYKDPVDTYSTNVLGTVNTLEAIRQLGQRCAVVNVTTDKCYENKGWVWGYRESDGLGGRDPYSSSKACAELVGQSYRDSFFPPSRLGDHGVGIASARAGNVIGGGDWTPRQLIPEAIAAFAAARPVVLRHPDAVRPWQHVLDCLTGYLALAEALSRNAAEYGGAWNFGPSYDDARPVSYVAESLASHWKLERAWVQDTAHHAPEERRLRLDANKAAAGLGWRCRLPLDVALPWVAHWYLEHQRGRPALDLCRAQVADYLAAAKSVQPG